MRIRLVVFSYVHKGFQATALITWPYREETEKYLMTNINMHII